MTTVHRTVFRRGINVLTGLWLNGTQVTASAAEINALTSQGAATTDIAKLVALTATAAEINKLDVSANEAGGLDVLKVAKFRFDPSLTAGMRTIAAHGLGVTIPISAVVVGGFVDVNTAFTSAGGNAGTVAISVESANDIISAAAVSGAPYSTIGLKAIIPKANTPESTGIKLTAAREITATVAGQALTAGKLTGFLYYVESAVSA